MARDYLVGHPDALAEGGRLVVRCGEREVGVFRLKGKLYAWYNLCPHRQGPVCQGRVYPRVTEPLDAAGHTRTLAYDETRMQVVCPWHGYEFDLATGQSQGHATLRLRPVEVREEKDAVYVTL